MMAGLNYRRPEIVDRIPLDRHTVIEASAGTGKTFTIEHLVIEILLTTETRLEQILAVTFTEKAAVELRARIRATIEKTLRGESEADETIGPLRALSEEHPRRLRDALFAFERAPIHTIHSFCHRMLADLAFQSGTRLNVEVADARTLFHEAFRAELRERFAPDEWMSNLLEEWLADEKRDADRLEALLFTAYRRRYLETRGPERNTAGIKELLAAFDAKTLANEFDRTVSHKTVRSNALGAIEEIANAIKKSGRDELALRRELESGEFEKLLKVAQTPYAGLSAGTQRFLRAAAEVRFAATLEARVADTFLEPVGRRFDALKRERGVLDFDDMPGWLCAALEGPQGEALAATLRQRFRYGLIDEFQDTDDLQWRIFRRIFVESRGANHLLVIGDPKQAIYAFRGADVFAYLAARRELTRDHNAALVALVDNFRSTSGVIDAINLTFDKSPAPAFFSAGEIGYGEPLKCGRPRMRATRSGSAIKPVTLIALPPGGKMSALRYRAALGRHIAETLRQILTGKEAITITESQTESRRVKAGGVYVLTRTLQESNEIATYLRDAGVPYAFYKQDGLFETREAGHVLDVLRAVAEPHRRSNRYKAWATPFFNVQLRDLPGLDDVPPSHPLMARLLDWKAMADREQFAELFSAMMHGSGLAARELLLTDTLRELTNYEHMFEILLERAITERASLAELIEMLASWVDGREMPPGENAGVQRLDSERDAVQIMTVHKSKGLEADVVVLFGGYARGYSRDDVTVFHTGGARQVVLGRDAREAARAQIKEEEQQEDERLLYVALTRARAKLYLALFPKDATRMRLNGYYQYLNARLNALASDTGEHRSRFGELFETVQVGTAGLDRRTDAAKITEAIRAWAPAEALLDDRKDSETMNSLAALGVRHAPLAIHSYTSLRRHADERETIEQAIFKYDLDAEAAEVSERQDLAGGRTVGIFLHEVIERIDLAELAGAQNLEAWKANGGVRDLIADASRRHQIPNREAWLERGAEIVFNTLRSPIAVGAEIVPALARCVNTREMEFTFPIPARDHPLLAANRGGEWKIEHGLLVGFVDFVFRHRDRTYFADWKSNLLRSYDSGAIAAHVADNYTTQAQIYTIGVVRLLGIRNEREYEERFGGLVYLFIRGIKPGDDGRTGVYYHRPKWAEIVAYEHSLMALGDAHAWTR
ncbi:MAG: UvrD-helicase domain-containing protein [Candidatus Binataceae bacterium]